MMKLNICSLGDPTNPKTWSGTPYNLYSELLKKNCIADAFSSIVNYNKWEQQLINFLNKTFYSQTDDFTRGAFQRYSNAQKTIKRTNKSISNLTLHLGTLDLPFLKSPNNQQHFLYCDSTWNLWSTYSSNMGNYSKQMLIDAEKLEEKAYKQMSHIFSISHYVKENLIQHYNINTNKITVVGTGLGLIKPYYGDKNYNNKKILFVAKGRFEEKGGSLVIEAFKQASKIDPNLELNIVGQNNLIERIKHPKIKVYGYVSIEKLQEIFNENSLFIMPALNEPWGLVYLEAMACKMPIIGLNRNSFPEISGYGKYGYAINTTNNNELTEIIINSFSQVNNLIKIGKSAQDYCLTNFNWSLTVQKILDIIQQY